VRQMSREGAVLALDVGTSSCRASFYDSDGRAAADHIAQVTYAPTVTADGGAELDAQWLLVQVFACIDQLLSTTGQRDAAAPPIVAVATTTFWHSLLGLDDRGRPLTPVYPWLDARSRSAAAELRRRLDQHAVHARTGCVLHWSYWPAKLVWLRQTTPEICQQVRRWVSFGEWLIEQATGLIGASVSMASGTGLLNTHACAWDDDLVQAIQVDPRHLPPIIRLNQMQSTTAELATRWPALHQVPWLPAVGDGASSNIGAGCATPEFAAVMIGTSGAERSVWSPTGPFTIPWGTWAYRVDERRLVIGGALNDGGALVNWLHSSLRLLSLEAAEAQVATMAPDAHGLTVLPFWGGERSTGWADDARGAVVGLRLHTQPVDILRACMEAVALRFGEIDRLLQQALPGEHEIVGTGGALLHSPTWMQILADVLGRPLLASSEAEASSRGAALLALETLGRLASPLEGLRPAGRQRVQPVPAHTEIYRAAADRQRRLYDAVIA
jgi:gluconokinase